MKCKVCEQHSDECTCDTLDTIFYYVSFVAFMFYAFCFLGLLIGAFGAFL